MMLFTAHSDVHCVLSLLYLPLWNYNFSPCEPHSSLHCGHLKLLMLAQVRARTNCIPRFPITASSAPTHIPDLLPGLQKQSNFFGKAENNCISQVSPGITYWPHKSHTCHASQTFPTAASYTGPTPTQLAHKSQLKTGSSVADVSECFQNIRFQSPQHNIESYHYGHNTNWGSQPQPVHWLHHWFTLSHRENNWLATEFSARLSRIRLQNHFAVVTVGDGHWRVCQSGRLNT